MYGQHMGDLTPFKELNDSEEGAIAEMLTIVFEKEEIPTSRLFKLEKFVRYLRLFMPKRKSAFQIISMYRYIFFLRILIT